MSTQAKPRILIITTTFPRWPDDPGPAPFVFNHARALQEFFEVTVLAPHFAGAARDEVMDGVRVKRFRYAWPARLELLSDGAGIRRHLRRSWGRKLLAPLLLVAELAAIFRELRGHDYINSHWLVPSGFLATLALAMIGQGRRHVITVHAADYDLLTRWPGGAILIRFMARRASTIVCVSKRFAEGIGKITAGKARTVVQPMGVELDRFRFSASARTAGREKMGAGEGPLIFFAGKLSAKKGVDVLLRAAALMKKAGRDFRVAIAGDGELAAELKRLADDLEVADRVVFLGAAPNRELAGLYSAADAVAVPSVRDPAGETEGMPVVVLEALAAGRPVVATRLCSVPEELIGHGAIEVIEGDPERLAAGLDEALTGRVKVDAAAVSRYDLAMVAETYRRLFREES